jgi:excisionase family DNA binding protein
MGAVMLMMHKEGRIYTPAEVAQALRVGEETIRREIRRKRLPAIQIGRQYRITPGDLIGWLGRERYLELFSPLEELFSLLGSGGLADAEAQTEAEALVRRARGETVRTIEGPAPSADEVRARRR